MIWYILLSLVIVVVGYLVWKKDHKAEADVFEYRVEQEFDKIEDKFEDLGDKIQDKYDDLRGKK